MDSYFYHGIERYCGCYSYALEVVLNILKEGLKSRNSVRHYSTDNEFNHVCLYKKNNEVNYDDSNVFANSARQFWIDNQFVIIISPDIDATKTGSEDTNLVDEWRSNGDIDAKKIVGLALPYDSINDYLKSNDNGINRIQEDKKNLKELLPIVENLAKNLNIFIVNSNEENFSDKLNQSLTQKNKL